jgi:hypothetical protein
VLLMWASRNESTTGKMPRLYHEGSGSVRGRGELMGAVSMSAPVVRL